MPNYSYACTECGHAFDIYQGFSEDALTTCPQCQGRLRKKFSAVGVVFKGSGFYRNDARSADNGAKSGAAESASGGEAGSNDSTSASESKPAESKSDTKDKSSSGSAPVASDTTKAAAT